MTYQELTANLTHADRRLILDIVAGTAPAGVDRLTLVMDLELCHAVGAPLDLPRMMEAVEVAALNGTKSGQVWHDLFGINQSLDRKTGRLLNCFSPRFSLPEEKHQTAKTYDPRRFQAVTVAKALEIYKSTGMKVNSAYTPAAMMRTAAAITGQTFKARDYLGAASALRAFAETL